MQKLVGLVGVQKSSCCSQEALDIPDTAVLAVTAGAKQTPSLRTGLCRATFGKGTTGPHSNLGY